MTHLWLANNERRARQRPRYGTKRRVTCGGALHIALGLLLVGCGAVSPSTDKNSIRLIEVVHDVEPRQTIVGPGDEVRWHNTLPEPIVINFPASAVNRVSCNIGFKTEEHIGLSAVVGPNASASLCFVRQGKYNYQVRLNQHLPSAFADKRAILWVVGRGERNPDPYEEYTNITP